jgi:hypothetical protein
MEGGGLAWGTLLGWLARGVAIMSLSLRATGIEAVYKEVTKGHLSKKGNKSVGEGDWRRTSHQVNPTEGARGHPSLQGYERRASCPFLG